VLGESRAPSEKKKEERNANTKVGTWSAKGGIKVESNARGNEEPGKTNGEGGGKDRITISSNQVRTASGRGRKSWRTRAVTQKEGLPA